MKTRGEATEVLAIDAGGTMTDTIIVDAEGEFTVGKAKTTPEDESVGVINSSRDACGYWDLPLEEGFGTIETGVYSGTAMVNRLLSRESEDDVGVILNRGFEDQPRIGRARQSWQGYSYNERLHVNSHRHDPPLITLEWIRGVQERVDCFGEVVCELYEDQAQQAVRDLLRKGADSLVVCFMHSYQNPVHEQRLEEIAHEVMESLGRTVPVYLSSEHYPHREEVPRMNTIMAEAFAARPSQKQFENIEEAIEANEGHFDLRVMASHGGTIDPDTQELARTLVSGPIGGIIGGISLSEEIGYSNIACTDIGGTSFDMGIITEGDFSIDYRPSMARLLLSLPMIDMESVGAGTGSYVRIDPAFDRIELGPDSAGDKIGVCNRDAGVQTVTVTDCHVALGIINPDNFLGGKMDIDREVAVEAVREQVAQPLGLSLVEACQSVIDVLETRLRTSLQSTISGSGYSSEEYVCLSYGGGGPVHTVGYTRNLNFREVLVPSWAAAFSAFGCGTADHEYRYDRTITLPVDPEATEEEKRAIGRRLTQIWKDLENRVSDQFEPDYQHDEVTFLHQFRGQYQGQLESITVDSPLARVNSGRDLDAVLGAFETRYAEIYSEAVRSPELGHNFTQLTVRGTVDTVKPKIPNEPTVGPEPPEKARVSEREVYLDGKWHHTPIYDMEALRAGNKIQGPAIIEQPATTFVLPPGFKTWLDSNRIFHLQEG